MPCCLVPLGQEGIKRLWTHSTVQLIIIAAAGVCVKYLSSSNPIIKPHRQCAFIFLKVSNASKQNIGFFIYSARLASMCLRVNIQYTHEYHKLNRSCNKIVCVKKPFTFFVGKIALVNKIVTVEQTQFYEIYKK